MSKRRSRCLAQQLQAPIVSATGPDEVPRRQQTPVGWQGRRQDRCLRAKGMEPPGDRDKLWRRRQAAPHRASTLRQDVTTGTPATPLASAIGAQETRLNGGSVSRLPTPSGWAGAEMTFGSDLRTRAVFGQRRIRGTALGPGESHHAHATRKSHWTWRPASIPWDRHSFGRERRSGRRFPRGSPQGNHVKVAGRGTNPCRSGWLASQTGFGPVQGEAPTACERVALRCREHGSFGPLCAASKQRLPRGMRQPSNGQAQGSIGRPPGGNSGWTQRTLQWTNALRSSDPARSHGSSRPARGIVRPAPNRQATARGYRPRCPRLEDRFHASQARPPPVRRRRKGERCAV